jgi:GT2 family glycosyltransferase
VARPDIDLLTTDAWLVRNGEAFRRCYVDGYGFELGDQRTAIIRDNFVYGMVAIRRDLVRALGGFDETLRHAEDWELIARAVLSGARVGLVPEPLVRYRIHEASKSASAVNRAKGAVGVLERILAGAPLRPAERRLAEQELRRRRGELALAEAKEALRTAGSEPRARSWRAATAPAVSLPTRAKAVATAIAPGLAARRHVARSEAEAPLTGGLA